MSSEENESRDAAPHGGGWRPIPQGGEYDAEATAFVQLPPEDMLDAPLAAPGHGYVPPQIPPAAAGGWTVPEQTSDGEAPHPWTEPEAGRSRNPYDPYAGQQPYAGPGPQGGQGPRGGREPHDAYGAQDPHGAPQAYASQGPYGEGESHGAQGPYGEGESHAGHEAQPGRGPRGAGDPRGGEGAQDPHATGQWTFPEAEQSSSGPAAAPATGDLTGRWTIPVAQGDIPEESGEFTTSALAAQWGGRTPPATLPGGAPAPWATTPVGGTPAEGTPVGGTPASGTPVPGADHPATLPGGAPAPWATEAYPAREEQAGPAADPRAGQPSDESRAGQPSDERHGRRDAETHPGAGGDASEAVADPEQSAGDAAGRSEAAPAEAGPAEVGPIGAGSAEVGPIGAGSAEVGPIGAGSAEGSENRGAPESDTALQGPPGSPAAGDTADPDASAAEEDLAAATATTANDEHPHTSYLLRVNGADRPVTDAWIGESLLYVLRERLGLAGAKDGCSQGECGACNVQVDGRLVASCLVPAATAAGSEVRTVEGLATDGEPSDVQRALAACGAVQCGFCIPGMAMTVHDLLEGNHAPTEIETRQALSGNLCRCSGYRGVLDAVREVVAGREASATAAAEAGDEAREGTQDGARIPHQAPPGAGSVQPHPHDGGMV
ncbi:2Fe-2S iron-sulfur cluster-binding protein [Streptomyces marianii]|uniref:2Fe-2S iron-sulfur cluster binding domain-containing protein n=1 Tax=Streptomyces marianii TaxID=1817406 RepID=A0A5R9E9B0_9ACTN|nr:2Fe-2S iron-sulfur cluster-binding protein [Streptomyces marianii]TLQ45635.1 2Fe-2S iron-sulfur cluster binding domain-containing protein [Streptomyces marianii]